MCQTQELVLSFWFHSLYTLSKFQGNIGFTFPNLIVQHIVQTDKHKRKFNSASILCHNLNAVPVILKLTTMNFKVPYEVDYTMVHELKLNLLK